MSLQLYDCAQSYYVARVQSDYVVFVLSFTSRVCAEFHELHQLVVCCDAPTTLTAHVSSALQVGRVSRVACAELLLGEAVRAHL